MFLKILATAVLLIVAWTVATRFARPATKRHRRASLSRKEPPRQLVKCSGCGIYLPAGQVCDCSDSA